MTGFFFALCHSVRLHLLMLLPTDSQSSSSGRVKSPACSNGLSLVQLVGCRHYHQRWLCSNKLGGLLLAQTSSIREQNGGQVGGSTYRPAGDTPSSLGAIIAKQLRHGSQVFSPPDVARVLYEASIIIKVIIIAIPVLNWDRNLHVLPR